MLARIHQKLGTAGFIISVVALVVALGGGAYAASGSLTGKQKKEVEKIAKKFAGKPGATGPAGATGPSGLKGDPGAQGDAGAQGVAGASGAPGAAGKEGSPWTAGGTLPSGKTETGTFVAGPQLGTEEVATAISFPIPLSAKVSAHMLSSEEQEIAPTAECPGSSKEPLAAKGNLCIYQTSNSSNPFTVQLIEDSEEGAPGAGKVGAVLRLEGVAEETRISGVWAVTAP